MTATATPIEKVRTALEERHWETADTAAGFRAECPAHRGDRKLSLSVDEGIDGTVLLRCHRGCDARAIVDALDLRMRDLFPGTRREWKRPEREAPKVDELSARAARLLRVTRLLDAAGESWYLTLGFRCPCCGCDGAWMRGCSTLVLECPEGCPQEAILFHLTVQAARERVPA